jgi:hypothetical protein
VFSDDLKAEVCDATGDAMKQQNARLIIIKMPDAKAGIFI